MTRLRRGEGAAAHLPQVERYLAAPLRRRLLLGLLAMATAVGVILTLLAPPGGVQRKVPAAAAAASVAASGGSAASAAAPAAPRAAGAAACQPGQVRGCVGGQADVLAPVAASLPLPPSTPAAAAASSRP